jgi:Type II CAAX prenyl endopeptidase Rce1-like
MVTFILLFVSFPIGSYLVLNTNLGGNLTYKHPIEFRDIVFISFSPLSSIKIELGLIFIMLWLIYLLIFTIAFLGPRKDFLHALYNLIYEKRTAYWNIQYNYLLMTIVWLGVYLVATKALDFLQSLFGLRIGEPTIVGNYLLQFFQLTNSPLREEFIFRIFLIGIPCLLVLGNMRTIKEIARTLWHPGWNRQRPSWIVYSILIMNALFFGFSHVLFTSGWDYGKVSQASIGGWILGWLYYRYGFPTAVILHWSSNYGIFTYGFYGYLFYGYKWNSEKENPILGSLDVVLSLIGIIAIGIYIYSLFYNQKILH